MSVVVPTRNRADYLAVALSSVLAQETDDRFEVVVVDDGSTDFTARVAERAGVRRIHHSSSRGLNAARNSGIAATTGPLIAFVDDDVRTPPGWLAALLAGTREMEWAEAFGGPIRASLEGPAPRSCGRESAPVTTLDLGPDDRETDLVWGANLSVRRSAIERVGGFDESLSGNGDEEEWLMRLREHEGRIAYVADAWLDHRRAGNDARLRALARAEYRRGRAARVSNRRRQIEPSLPHELRDLAGAGWHLARRRCPQGAIMMAHSAGRLVEALGARR